jgi:malonyl-CoA decarboxylase
LPQLDTFSTLSPIPQFVEWLTSRAVQSSPLLKGLERDHLRTVLQQFTKVPPNSEDISERDLILMALDVKEWELKPELSTLLKPVLLRLAAIYIYKEKRRGKALCQVANFHIRNGAIFERVNWLADVTPKV